jgi:hypothetical protein
MDYGLHAASGSLITWPTPKGGNWMLGRQIAPGGVNLGQRWQHHRGRGGTARCLTSGLSLWRYQRGEVPKSTNWWSIREDEQSNMQETKETWKARHFVFRTDEGSSSNYMGCFLLGLKYTLYTWRLEPNNNIHTCILTSNKKYINYIYARGLVAGQGVPSPPCPRLPPPLPSIT